MLERGYSIVQTAEGTVLRDAGVTAPKANLSIRLHKGMLKVKVSSTKLP